MSKIRLTDAVRTALLAENEGFRARTSFDSRNNSCVRDYLINEGKVLIREIGKTSWSDSRYDKTWTADKDEVIRFLRNFLYKLKL